MLESNHNSVCDLCCRNIRQEVFILTSSIKTLPDKSCDDEISGQHIYIEIIKEERAYATTRQELSK